MLNVAVLDDGRSLNWSCSFSLFTNPLFSLQRSSRTKFIDRKHKGVGVGKEKIDTLVRFPIVNNNNKRLWTGYCIAIVQGPRCTGNTFQMIYCLKRFFGITLKKYTLKRKIKPWKKCSVLFKLIPLLCSNYLCVYVFGFRRSEWKRIAIFQVKLLCCLGFPFDRIIWYLSFQ